MPTYSYSCLDCEHNFELFFYIKDYNEQPVCTNCGSTRTYRLYAYDILTQNASVKKADNELKTLGDLANRNRDKLTDEQKGELHKKHNDYKDTTSDNPLPQGMKRMKKGQKTIWPT